MQSAAPSYRVIAAGLREGELLEHVMRRLAAHFQRSSEQMRALLCAPRALVKQQLGYADALRYQDALERCGCRCLVEAERDCRPVTTLWRHASPGTGIVINIPEGWHASMVGPAFHASDDLSGAHLTSVGVPNPGLTLREWAAQRFGHVRQHLPALQCLRGPYPLSGAGWGGRVQALGSDYRGTLPGMDGDSHYLVLCLRTERSLVWLTLEASAADFDAHAPLFQWLLEHQLDVQDWTPLYPARH